MAMTAEKANEVILTVPTLMLFHEGLEFQGTETDKKRVAQLVDNIDKYPFILKRGEAEENDALKQPIPYAMIRRGKEIFVYKRLEGGGEEKLHGKLSIGVGGHLNPINDNFKFSELLMPNLERELEEEVEITDKDAKIEVIGFINDDSNAVGRVHVGVLCTIDVAEDSEVTVKEVDQLEGSWMTIDQLKSEDVYERLENWSKIAVDSL